MTTKVIVQGIPIPPEFRLITSEARSDFEKKLKEFFTTFGSATCTYLWSNQAPYLDHSLSYTRKRFNRQEESCLNFAYLMFDNAEDAARVCKLAANQKIQFENSILTMTIVQDSSSPFELLDDDCLRRVFSFLDLETKVTIEEVCKHWRKIGPTSWSSMTKLDLSKVNASDARRKQYLQRCGPYLRKLNCLVDSLSIIDFICHYCEHIESLTLDIFISDAEKGLCYLFVFLHDLKKLKLIQNVEDFDYTFLRFLPATMEKINFSYNVEDYREPQDLDLSKFQNLKKLTLSTFILDGSHVKGIQNMENLTYLCLDTSKTYRSLTRQIACLKNLTSLRIPTSGITDDILIQIVKNNRKLVWLDVSDAIALTDRSIREVSSLPHLETLNVSRLDVTLKNLHQMPELVQIECCHCPKLTNAAVGKLIELAPKLEYIQIANSSVDLDVFAIVNKAVIKRANEAHLTIETSYLSRQVNREGFTGWLKIEYGLEPEFQFDYEEEHVPDAYNDEVGEE